MSRDVICLPQTATLRDAARQLQTGAMHALPVVAPGDVLAGIITSTDLIEALRRELDFSTSMPDGDTSDTSLSTWDSSARGTSGLM
jgi:CBS-domain-containing membrane protein